MATAPDYLTEEQFGLYGQQKPHYEYWYGEAIQKSMGPYTARPLALCVEILSPQDDLRQIVRKAALCAR